MRSPFLRPNLAVGEGRDRGDQRGGSQVNWKKRKMNISLPLLSHLFLKYAYTVDVLIHQFTHMEFSNSTLPILLNF